MVEIGKKFEGVEVRRDVRRRVVRGLVRGISAPVGVESGEGA